MSTLFSRLKAVFIWSGGFLGVGVVTGTIVSEVVQ